VHNALASTSVCSLPHPALPIVAAIFS
jgi:hypothetical protein